MIRAAASGMLGAITVMLTACLPDPVFVCTSEAQCSDLGEGARCEAVQFCSTVDQNCSSGRRFHEFAGDGLAGLCTDVTCGDGEVVGDELCDDGNDIDGDGCNNDCRPSGSERWSDHYESTGNVRDRCYSVAVDEQGNVTFIGHASTTVDVDGVPTTHPDVWVRQYDDAGMLKWTVVEPGLGTTNEEGWSVLALGNGDVLVAGSHADSSFVDMTTGDEVFTEDIWLARIDGNGGIEWEHSWDGGASVMQESWIDVARDIAISPDGYLFAIGYATIQRDRETDLWIQRRTLDGGDPVTYHRDGYADALGANAQDRAHGLAVVGDKLIGVGVKQTSAPPGEPFGTSHYWIESFDREGRTAWTEEGVVGEPSSVLTAIATTAGGDVLVAGWRAHPQRGDADVWLQRRRADGEVVWERVLDRAADEDRANNIVAIGDDAFVVAGELGNGTGTTDAWVARYADEDTLVWEWMLSGPMGARDTAWGLAVAPDGSIYACGYQSTPNTEWDIWMQRFAP